MGRDGDVDGWRRPLQGNVLLQDLWTLPLGEHSHLHLHRQVGTEFFIRNLSKRIHTTYVVDTVCAFCPCLIRSQGWEESTSSCQVKEREIKENALDVPISTSLTKHSSRPNIQLLTTSPNSLLIVAHVDVRQKASH